LRSPFRRWRRPTK